jgi:hypothetical protein
MQYLKNLTVQTRIKQVLKAAKLEMPIQMNYDPYINIIVKDENIKILTGGVTDDKSAFKIIKISLGKNIVEIQFIGYSNKKSKFYRHHCQA